MSAISAEMVKQLRAQTGAGMMDCKQALAEAGGNFDQAIEVLRKKGLKDLSKRAGKTAAERTLGVYVHPGDQVVAIVELNCETDFVARNDEFRALARDLALHVAAMKPRFLTVEEIPEEVMAKEREIFEAQMNEAQKAKADKILPGKLEKFYEEAVLTRQIYVKDESGKQTIADLVNQLSVKCGEKVQIRRFSRYEVGEGIERAAANLADDVAQTISQVQ
ncbi:MAG: translation elongation factor Ts [Proteobacteria bacterium]|nr:MAG: translation elongation factor Ts [Pseudomonadota bacterium]